MNGNTLLDMALDALTIMLAIAAVTFITLAVLAWWDDR